MTKSDELVARGSGDALQTEKLPAERGSVSTTKEAAVASVDIKPPMPRYSKTVLALYDSLLHADSPEYENVTFGKIEEPATSVEASSSTCLNSTSQHFHYPQSPELVSHTIEEQPLYVNAKQFHRILKRRVARQRLEEALRLTSKGRKPYLHESRHYVSMRRPRGPGGRFLTADEVKEIEKTKELGRDEDVSKQPFDTAFTARLFETPQSARNTSSVSPQIFNQSLDVPLHNVQSAVSTRAKQPFDLKRFQVKRSKSVKAKFSVPRVDHPTTKESL